MRNEDEWILTFTGKAYWPLDPRPDDVCIEDIAHGLSMLCRYAGQCKHFYSVAEHSVLVSEMVPFELALEALLHDASEAYCSDIVRPLKKKLPDYQEMEALNDMAIRIHFHLPVHEHWLVKEADTNILLTEATALLPRIPEGREWKTGGKLIDHLRLKFWMPQIAEMKFLERYYELERYRNEKN